MQKWAKEIDLSPIFRFGLWMKIRDSVALSSHPMSFEERFELQCQAGWKRKKPVFTEAIHNVGCTLRAKPRQAHEQTIVAWFIASDVTVKES